jgi:hypothetical protein
VLLAATCALSLVLSGCLAQSYEIPKDEVQRLLQTAPGERGKHVRAVQRFSTSSDPQPAPEFAAADVPPPGYGRGSSGYWVPHLYLGWGSPYYSPSYRYGRSGAPMRDNGPPASSRPSSSSKSSAGKDAGAAVAAAIVAGVVVGVALAATEGARYDGWVAVHPHHPVHLLGSGEDRIVALDELTAGQIGDRDAVLVGYEGSGMWRRGRAPLSRTGLTFQFGLGDAAANLQDYHQPSGLGFHFGAGWFPSQWVGVLLDSRLTSGEYQNGSYHDFRVGLEGQWLPIQLWRVHLGGAVGIGQSWVGSSGGDLLEASHKIAYVSAGGLAEVDLTTRLALTFRYLRDWSVQAPSRQALDMGSWFVGLAVY